MSGPSHSSLFTWVDEGETTMPRCEFPLSKIMYRGYFAFLFTLRISVWSSKVIIPKNKSDFDDERHEVLM